MIIWIHQELHRKAFSLCVCSKMQQNVDTILNIYVGSSGWIFIKLFCCKFTFRKLFFGGVSKGCCFFQPAKVCLEHTLFEEDYFNLNGYNIVTRVFIMNFKLPCVIGL